MHRCALCGWPAAPRPCSKHASWRWPQSPSPMPGPLSSEPPPLPSIPSVTSKEKQLGFHVEHEPNKLRIVCRGWMDRWTKRAPLHATEVKKGYNQHFLRNTDTVERNTCKCFRLIIIFQEWSPEDPMNVTGFLATPESATKRSTLFSKEQWKPRHQRLFGKSRPAKEAAAASTISAGVTVKPLSPEAVQTESILSVPRF